MNKEKIFVEFVGLPGSGKTTIASEIIKEISFMDYDFDTRDCLKKNHETSGLNRYIYGIFFIIKHPIITLKIFYLFLNSKRLCKILKTFISQGKTVNKNSSLIIYDQGVLNSIFYIKNRRINWEFLIKAYSKILSQRKILIVFIDLDFETALCRANDRLSKNHFTETMNKKEVFKIFSQYTKNYNDFQKKFPRIEILEIDGRNKAKKNANLIIKAIKEDLLK